MLSALFWMFSIKSILGFQFKGLIFSNFIIVKQILKKYSIYIITKSTKIK